MFLIWIFLITPKASAIEPFCEPIPSAVSAPPAPTSSATPDERNKSFNLRTMQIDIAGRSVPVKVMDYKPTEEPAAGTIVYLCGGPAACIVGRPTNVPKNFHVVTFDYLGLGLNSASAASPEMMSVETQGAVAKELVRTLHIKDYVIYGQSYGSAVATVAASLINRDGNMPQPKSVMLEGVLGPKKTAIRDFSEVSRRMWALLSEADREAYRNLVHRFKSENPDLAEKFDAHAMGVLWRGPKFGAQNIHSRTSVPIEQRVAAAKDGLLNKKQSLDHYYLAGGCEVIRHVERPGIDSGWLFEKGLVKNHFQDAEKRICGCRTLKNDYDPCKFQIRSPMIYLNGDGDPAAPLQGAKAHFACQKHAKAKEFVAIKDGGHGNTFEGLILCVDKIYRIANEANPQSFSELQRMASGCPENGAGNLENTDAGH